MNECECELAGWCERHQRMKSDRMLHLCKTDARYRASWSGAKPEQRPEQAPINSGAWVRYVKLLRKPEDAGVGDTIQRIAAKFGGERFKRWAARLGIPCGCSTRQADWNRMYPY